MVGGENHERAARKDAPTDYEYRKIKRIVNEELEDKYQLHTLFAIVTMGELGLRPGEVAHINRDWVDLSRGIIEIPDFEPCSTGRDGKVCGDCRSAAKQRVDYRPDERTLEDELEKRWRPKLEDSARTVPYNWNDRIVDLYDVFFEEYDEFPVSHAAINRRVDWIAEYASWIEDKDEIYPHAFRGHAAKMHASKGMRAHQLRRFMGWAKVDAAMKYIELVAKDVEMELQRIHRGGVY